MSEISVYVSRSHGWLYEKLHERAVPPTGVALAPTRDDAELLVYLEPPWYDAAAPDRLRGFSPSELARTFVYTQSDLPVPWAPGLYASLPRRSGATRRAFAGAFYVPYQLREPGALAEHLERARSRERDLLWSFVGTVGNAPLRTRLQRLPADRALVEDTQRFSDTVRWGWRETHADEAQRAFQRYADSIGRSKFVLCPRGRGLSSIRIFEAMEAGRCPVIVADSWLPPPFVDWDSCSISVPENAVEKIPELLRARETEADELGANARLAWERRFSPETQLATLVCGCLEIRDRISTPTRLLVALTSPLEPSSMRRALSPVRRLAQRLRR